MIVYSNILKKRQYLATTCQFISCHLHMRGCWIEGAQLKPLVINPFPGMGSIRVDQDQTTRRCEIFCAFVRKRLATMLNEADHIIVMAMTRIGMLNVMRVQKPEIKLGIVPDFRPFLCLHHISDVFFTINGSLLSCRILPNARPK